MTNFIQKRFDDRLLLNRDDGQAFETFVVEFLTLQMPDENFLRGLAKGRDGAIDFINPEAKTKHITECKFVGREAKDNAYSRWNKVKSVLTKNLVAAGENKGAEKYKPWLKSNGPVEKYYFATSQVMSDANERQTLQKSITSYFREISSKHPQLEHLTKINVEVFFWDDFLSKATQFPALFFRWFGGYPPNYCEISDSFGVSEHGFKRFLMSKNLPYFSRDDFESPNGDPTTQLFDKCFNHLENEDEDNGPKAIVVSGPGGVGKTRLCIEICQRADGRSWWPLVLRRKARLSDLDQICSNHAVGAKILLFVDYAEAFSELDQMQDAVMRLAQWGHKVAVVAATRASSLTIVNDGIDEFDIHHISLHSVSGQDDYYGWVVQNILDHFSLPDAEKIAQSCRGLPVLATFAAFLFRKDRDKFNQQFANLSSTNDFLQWAERRLKFIEEKYGEPVLVARRLSDLALRLPMPKVEWENLRAQDELSRQLLDHLEIDHWVELDEDGLSAVHDVLADAILGRHLFGIPGHAQRRLNDLLDNALMDRRLDRFFAVLDRQQSHEGFDELSGRDAIHHLFEKDRISTLDMLSAWGVSRILTPDDLINLLVDDLELQDRFAITPETDLKIAQTAQWLNNLDQGEFDKLRATQALAAPLQRAVDRSNTNSLIIREALKLQPEKYAKTAFDLLDRIIPSRNASRVLMEVILKSGIDLQEIEPYLDRWLERFGNSHIAVFVYRCWLEVNGDSKAVERHMLEWLERHWHYEDATFLTKELSKQDDLSPKTIALIIAWSGVHAEHEDAIYRLSRVSQWFRKIDLTLKLRKLIFQASKAVIGYLLSKPALNEGQNQGCRILFTNLAMPVFVRDAYWRDTIELYVRALKHGNALESKTRLTSTPWILLLKDALETGLLNEKRDWEAIAHGLDLIRGEMKPDEFKGLLEGGFLGLKSPPST